MCLVNVRAPCEGIVWAMKRAAVILIFILVLSSKAEEFSDTRLQRLYWQAKDGVASSQNAIGLAYQRHGQWEKAGRWFRRAADQNHAIAMNNLGLALANGKVAPVQRLGAYNAAVGAEAFEDEGLSEAALWFRRAGERGHRGAQYNFGLALAEGSGVPRDLEAALLWFQDAAAPAASKETGSKTAGYVDPSTEADHRVSANARTAVDQVTAILHQQTLPAAAESLGALLFGCGDGGENNVRDIDDLHYDGDRLKKVLSAESGTFNGTAIASAWDLSLQDWVAFTNRFHSTQVIDDRALALLRSAALSLTRIVELMASEPVMAPPLSCSRSQLEQGRSWIDRWLDNIYHNDGFNTANEFAGENTDYVARYSLRFHDGGEEGASAVEIERLASDVVLAQLQQVYASLAIRGGDHQDLWRAARWNLARAMLPTCRARFASSEVHSSCWNTAVSSAITYFRRCGAKEEAAHAVVVARTEGHPLARTKYPASHSMQTPHVFFEGLTAQPWWDKRQFPVAMLLEDNYVLLLRDLRNLIDGKYVEEAEDGHVGEPVRGFTSPAGKWHGVGKVRALLATAKLKVSSSPLRRAIDHFRGGEPSRESPAPIPPAPPPQKRSISSHRPEFSRVFSPAAPIAPLTLETDRAGHGSWAEFQLFDGYRWNRDHCAIVPHMCRLLASTAAAGQVCGTQGRDPKVSA